MFIRFTALLSIAAVALAAPNVLDTRASTTSTTSNSCNSGSQYCCNQVTAANSTSASTAAGLVGVALGDVQVPVGLTCTPLTVIGLGTGSSCTQQSVCCTGNSYSGVIVIGCSPINVNV